MPDAWRPSPPQPAPFDDLHRTARQLPRAPPGLDETDPSFRTSHSQSARRVTAFLAALRKEAFSSLRQQTLRLRLWLRNLAWSCLSSLILDMFAAKRALGNARERELAWPRRPVRIL